MNLSPTLKTIQRVIMERPNAKATVFGSEEYRLINGTASFYQLDNGVLIATEVWELPNIARNGCNCSVFGYHIHEGGRCSGTDNAPFSDALSHYNPQDCEHPCHAGDLSPLFANDGYAFSMFFTDRFRVRDVVGKTVIIHDMPDDFTTQPSGNAGTRIACGVIKR